MCSQTLPVILSWRRKMFLRIFWLVLLALSLMSDGYECYELVRSMSFTLDIWYMSIRIVLGIMFTIILLRFVETRSIIGYDARAFRVQNTFTIFSDSAVTIDWQSHLEKIKLTDGGPGQCCLWVSIVSLFSLIPLKSIDKSGNPYYFFVPKLKYTKDFVVVEKQLKSIPNASKLLELIL